jgi:hypothetical protein
LCDGDVPGNRGSRRFGRDPGGDTVAPGHAFYDKFQKLLIEAGFDVFVEEGRRPYGRRG